ncbi:MULTISPECIES: outer membrane beta-barrel protein [Flavobacterium]|uniref:Outer membrane beta-barrel protein n=1 Tax=Flavobacterium sedimenticola TaxID=3043286 RepID=A0ABT6XRF6_9FLAO|nr:outer membrane beta-barrel protein [Flavobacterium sedimenticola]MDI9257432.1 outer membrane beta-barrel protein [Flavobacterium sedimenticola]
MKKIILTVAAVFAFGFANAQDKKEGSGEGFAKGDLYLSGSFNFSSEKTGDFKTDSFTIAPGLGYFISDNLAIEGSLAYLSGKENVDLFGDGDLYELKTSGFGISAGVKYFWTPASKFSLSVGGNVSYASIKSEVSGLGDSTSKIIGVNVPVGLHYFVSNSFALTTSWGGLGYSSNDNGGNGAEKTNGFNLGLDMSDVSFGLIYKL